MCPLICKMCPFFNEIPFFNNSSFLITVELSHSNLYDKSEYRTKCFKKSMGCFYVNTCISHLYRVFH